MPAKHPCCEHKQAPGAALCRAFSARLQDTTCLPRPTHRRGSHIPARQRVPTTWKATPVRVGAASGCGVQAQSPNSAAGAPALQREATRVRSAMSEALISARRRKDVRLHRIQYPSAMHRSIFFGQLLGSS